jgi:hypothetical protein
VLVGNILVVKAQFQNTAAAADDLDRKLRSLLAAEERASKLASYYQVEEHK